MCNQQAASEEVFNQISAAADNLMSCIGEFAQEHGKSILYGEALPTKAAEELAVMLRFSKTLRDALKFVVAPNNRIS